MNYKPLWYFDRKLWFFIIPGLILIKIITKNKYMRFTVLTHLSGYACESCWLITNQIISDLEANTLKLPILWDLKNCALKVAVLKIRVNFEYFNQNCKAGCVFPMDIVSILPHAAWAMRNSDQMIIAKTHPTLVRTVYK